MKRTFLFALLVSLSIGALAQDFPFGQYSEAEMNMKSYAKDTAAHAVVLREFGKTWLSSAERTPLVHEYHTKIKIFDSKAFSNGDVQLEIYKGDNDSFEQVSEIEAVTFYKDDNGIVQKATLDQKQIFHIKHNKHHDYVKFALPNLRPGCVIEYKYRLESPYLFNFHTWYFQKDIPKIYSEYEAHIPAIYNYNVVLRGPYKLTKNNAELERECFTPGGGAKCDCSKISYIMADVPAFIEESQMTSPQNFLSAIYFELSEYTDLTTGGITKITKDWKDIDYELKHKDEFGSQIKRKDLMKDRIQGVIAGKTDELEKAKATFKFVQKSMKWNGTYSIFSEDGIKKAWDSHSGTVGDINLSLVAALSAAGINTEAVLLSTRENGVVNKLFPVVSEFDYVVAKANIGDKTYLLDATDPLLPFGLLPIKCLNDQGRVMSLDKPSYWIDMVASQKRSSTYALDLTMMDDGKIKGTIIAYSSGYKALERRATIKKFNSVDEFVENMGEKMPKVKILKAEIVNLDSLDLSLSEKYEIEFKPYNGTDNSRLVFNPFIFDQLTENPFKLTERTYPVDWGAQSDDKYILNMHLPDNFTIEGEPEKVAVAMPNGGGRFVTAYVPDTHSFTFSKVTQLNHSVYSPEEYPYLKELFNKIIQTEKADLVFKKK